MRFIRASWVVVVISVSVSAQSHMEKLSKEFSFEKVTSGNTLMIANINGSVDVTGYDGNKIVVEVEKHIKAKSEARLEKGKSELSLGVIDLSDTVILYINGLCNRFSKAAKNNWNGKRSGGWGYDWNGCQEEKGWRKDEGYDYKFNFTIKVPKGIHVNVSTVNEGDVTIENVTSSLVANNVNGSVRLKNIAGATSAYTINGDVELEYSRNPDKECSYYTLNGNIHANFKKSLAANLSFKSFNGNFYTNVDKLESLPVSLQKKEKGEGVSYRVSGNQFKMGSGGVVLNFETFNGNVYVKEN